METVFRVKRHWDEKQAPGLKLAKRQRTEGEVPVILTYAGTTTKSDSQTILSVIKSHQASSSGDLPSVTESSPSTNNKTFAIKDSSSADSISLVTEPDIDKLFKIYDAYQDRITNLQVDQKNLTTQEMGLDEREDNDSKFVYDIYYVSNDFSSKLDPILLDHDQRNYTLEHWCPENEILVYEENGESEDHAYDYDDEDSNAEGNPDNDYPDDEEFYGEDGQEVPQCCEDDDYYSDRSYDYITILEQGMPDLSFQGDEEQG